MRVYKFRNHNILGTTIRFNQTFFQGHIKRREEPRLLNISFIIFYLHTTMSSYTICLVLLFFTVVSGGVNNELSALRGQQNGILDLIELPIRYYLNEKVHAEDLNFMLGISIMKGKVRRMVSI